MLRKLYHNPPSIWVAALKWRLKRLVGIRPPAPPPPPPTPPPLPNINPITGAPLAATLGPEYRARRDPLIQSMIERIREGEPLAEVVKGFPAREYDERAMEYSFLAHWLLGREPGQPILDVGCVLNNKLVTNLLLERVGEVWLCNPAIEPYTAPRNPLYYHVSDLLDAFPDGRQFPLVTCLSTIEHIGYDNSQYGSGPPARFTEPQTETLVGALGKLATLVAPGGELLVSVPYGFREAIMHPKTRKIASQVFDFDSLQPGLAALAKGGIEATLRVFRAVKGGWVEVEPETCRARYAEGCPAAAAVAVLTGTKGGGAKGKGRRTGAASRTRSAAASAARPLSPSGGNGGAGVAATSAQSTAGSAQAVASFAPAPAAPPASPAETVGFMEAVHLPRASTVYARGWAYLGGPRAGAEVTYLINGKHEGHAFLGAQRPDLDERFPDFAGKFWEWRLDAPIDPTEENPVLKVQVRRNSRLIGMRDRTALPGKESGARLRGLFPDVLAEKVAYDLGYLKRYLAPRQRAFHQFKDIHQGRRAFLVGNGPSLNQIDLTRLKDEITFGVNGIFLMDGFSPTYYFTISENYAKNNPEKFGAVKSKKIFLPEAMRFIEDFVGPDQEIIRMVYEKPHNITRVNGRQALVPSFFSFRPDIVVQGGGTVLFPCMQLAFYMGIREIVLIGVDHNYGQAGEKSEWRPSGIHFEYTGQSHFRSDYRPKGEFMHLNHRHLDRAYRIGKRVFERNGGSIVNATPGTKLEIYPKVDYDSLF